MIQRIQSVWLLLASIAAFATFKFSFYTGNVISTTGVKQFEKVVATSNIFLLILTVAVAVASLVAIFLYNDRKRQLLVTVATFVASAICVLLNFKETGKFAEGQYALTAIVSFVVPVLLLLSARSIWKDEQLVKSVDRLR